MFMIRGLCKIVINRYWPARPERAPSSAQCLVNPAEPRSSLWRTWFILLIVAPIIYYLVFIGFSPRRYSSPEWRQTRAIPSVRLFAAPQNNISRHIFEGHVMFKTRVDSPMKVSYTNSTFQAYRRFHVANDGRKSQGFTLPLCTHISLDQNVYIKIRNVTIGQWYRNQVQRGGYYQPKGCRVKHRVAILVPIRGRDTNLAAFLFNIHPFLINQGLEYRIFVIEQTGDNPYNKGALFNAGYLEAQKYGPWDCMVFHEAHLLPANQYILYSCPAWPRSMCRYIKDATESKILSGFGGVTAMSVGHYEKVNGYSNLYWGWGGEDDDMFWRLRAANIKIMRYSMEIAVYFSLSHSKSAKNLINDELLKNAMMRYKHDGLSNVKYKLISASVYNLYTHMLINLNPENNNSTT